MRRPRILVVDDCIDTLELLKTTLEDEYDVYGLQDPCKVFDAVELAEPDAVILDLIMPQLGGFEILDELPAMQPAIRSTPFIVLSCKHSQEDQKKAYAKGAKLFISKPFEPDRLRRLLKMFFEGAGHREVPKKHSFKDVDRMLEVRGHYMISRLGREQTPLTGRPLAATANKDEKRRGSVPWSG